jgi:hypothetical protein
MIAAIGARTCVLRAVERRRLPIAPPVQERIAKVAIYE